MNVVFYISDRAKGTAYIGEQDGTQKSKMDTIVASRAENRYIVGNDWE